MAQVCKCRTIIVLVIGVLTFALYFLYISGYVTLPFIIIDRVWGDSFPDQHKLLSLAERVTIPQSTSDIYFSVLTTSKYHQTRLGRQFVTWIQTVDAKQIHVTTDGLEDMWTQALTQAGSTVIFGNCPRDTKKSLKMMCCKGGVQFEGWYQAREAGEVYNWYCHFDDDIYVNTAALVHLTQRYNSNNDQYLGNWKRLSKYAYHGKNRISNETAPGLFKYTERKRNDYRYANGPAYCISAPLMKRLEKYLRGQQFVDNCNKAQVGMDDMLPGFIIEGVLGVEITNIPEFTDQIHFTPPSDLSWYRRQVTVAGARVHLYSTRFHGKDRMLIYHCLLHPTVSWCR